MELVQNIDYRIQGYHKNKIYDSKGDLIEVEFYKNYDGSPVSYNNLKVKEWRTVYRDPIMSIPYKLVVDIEWYKGNGTAVIATKQIVKHINSFDGMDMNTKSRTRLVEIAQGYLLENIGLVNTQEFGTDIISERSAYIAGARQALLDVIDASVRSYMTQPIKDGVKAILDVAY